jgi:hypothetical protein
MRQKNGFDQFVKFKSKGIEFEVGDKYLFWQLTRLLIRKICQACSSKPLARQYNKRYFKTKLKIWKSEEVKDWSSRRFEDSTRICNSGRISGATDKGIDNRAHQLSTPEAH